MGISERMRRGLRRTAPPALAAAVLSACGDGALHPAGREASRVATVWWIMFGIAAVVFVVVLVVLVVALRSDPQRSEGRWAGTRLVVVGGIVVPAVVLMFLLGLTTWSGDDLRREGIDGAVPIEVTGHQYWWDVRYPAHEVRTANEIHVPVGREVVLELRSEDVIHSVWIPRLAGKIDLVPGRVNRMTMRADEPGRYQGRCAEFCGLQHARMRLEVVAHEPEDFEDWASTAAEPKATPPADAPEFEGWQAFMSAACVYCHAIKGTPAASEFGPDLTNLAGRNTLAAGLLPNERGALAGWILDPQRAKPGNHMPATWLEPEQLDALLDYLETLE